MRIGIYDPYLDTLGGGERYILTIAQCLSDTHTVSVFWNDRDIRAKAVKKFGLKLDSVAVVRNIFSRPFSLFERMRESRSYDTIIFLSDGSIPLLLFPSLILHFQFPVRVSRSVLDRLKLLRVHKVICNSVYTKEHIDKTYNIESRVVYPPVDIARFTSLREKKKNIIISVGRYSRLPDGGDFKKQTVLIQAFKRMIEQGLHAWELLIVTNALEKDKRYVENLEGKVRNYPIRILKNTPFEEITKLYKMSKIYWHAAGFGEDLKKFPERAEHFGISTVEAVLSGCVPVVFGEGGQREIISEGKNGFFWHDTEELIQKTEYIIREKKLLETIEKSGKEFLPDFSVGRFCKEISDNLS